MKTCKKCNLQKDLFSFYKDVRRLDGLMSYCKDCHNSITMATKKKNPQKYKEYYKIYQKNYTAPYLIKNSNALKANRMVLQAIEKGFLVRLSCEKCGDKKSYAHHPFYNYSEPLKVKWLCGKHHRLAHREEKLNIQIPMAQIEYKNNRLMRIEQSIDFYLNYHKIPSIISMRIKGNLLQVIKKEFALF